MNKMEQNKKNLTICRVMYEFPIIGGMTFHVIEHGEHLNPYCKKQFMISIIGIIK